VPDRARRARLPAHPEGTAFLAYAESLLRLNARAVEALRIHRIAIGASSNIGVYLLQPYIKSYFDSRAGRRPPDIQIHQNPVIADKLDAGEIDVATMEWWDNRPGYVARTWRREELVAIVPPDHRGWRCRACRVPCSRVCRCSAANRAPARPDFWRVTSVRSRAICKSVCVSAQPKR